MHSSDSDPVGYLFWSSTARHRRSRVGNYLIRLGVPLSRCPLDGFLRARIHTVDAPGFVSCVGFVSLEYALLARCSVGPASPLRRSQLSSAVVDASLLVLAIGIAAPTGGFSDSISQSSFFILLGWLYTVSACPCASWPQVASSPMHWYERGVGTLLPRTTIRTRGVSPGLRSSGGPLMLAGSPAAFG